MTRAVAGGRGRPRRLNRQPDRSAWLQTTDAGELEVVWLNFLSFDGINRNGTAAMGNRPEAAGHFLRCHQCGQFRSRIS